MTQTGTEFIDDTYKINRDQKLHLYEQAAKQVQGYKIEIDQANANKESLEKRIIELMNRLKAAETTLADREKALTNHIRKMQPR